MLSNLVSDWTDIAALALILAVFCLDVRFSLKLERQKEREDAF